MAGHVLPEAKLALCGTSVEFQPPPISLFLGNRDTDSQGRSHGAARLVYQKHQKCSHSTAVTLCRPERRNSQFFPGAHRQLPFFQESPLGRGSCTERLHNKAIFVR